MAFTTLTEGMQQLLKYWGIVNSQAAQFAGQAGTWTALRSAGAVGQPTQPTVTIQDMNAVYGLAVQNRTATSNLAGAQEGGAITGTMIGTDPNFRGLAAFNAAPMFNVRVNYTSMTGTELTTQWVTIQYPVAIDTTVTTFRGTIQTILSNMVATTGATGANYGQSLVGVTAISINAV